MDEELLRELQELREELRNIVFILLVFDCADGFGQDMYYTQSDTRILCYFWMQLVFVWAMLVVELLTFPQVRRLIRRVLAEIGGGFNNGVGLVGQQMNNLLLDQQPGQVFENMLDDPRWLENQGQDEELGNPIEGRVDQEMDEEQDLAMAGMEEPIPDPEGGGGE
ncbi:hypothetical protein EDL81_04060 [Ehrlichia ruminantium]|uniref:Uncharacterized protein n=1 Tax=Ehrlichia ruminantium TaxID=779 RepID=A0AAE6QBG4_EHRRU|nr:hypothetical protein [Ehrlichia ruminantium]QGR02791.1 hypothetical protein EDL81_04060 [Ehrlichia ruminantium]QGR03713.1 hypothetical protein EDL80_04060 [Ehrlichia ruminantium]